VKLLTDHYGVANLTERECAWRIFRKRIAD
jgi:hypothetical protein